MSPELSPLIHHTGLQYDPGDGPDSPVFLTGAERANWDIIDDKIQAEKNAAELQRQRNAETFSINPGPETVALGGISKQVARIRHARANFRDIGQGSIVKARNYLREKEDGFKSRRDIRLIAEGKDPEEEKRIRRAEWQIGAIGVLFAGVAIGGAALYADVLFPLAAHHAHKVVAQPIPTPQRHSINVHSGYLSHHHQIQSDHREIHPKVNTNQYTYNVASEEKPGHAVSLIQKALHLFNKKHHQKFGLEQIDGKTEIGENVHVDGHLVDIIIDNVQERELNQIIVAG